MLYDWKWNSCCLVDHQDFRLQHFSEVLRADILNALAVISVHIDFDDSVFEVWVCTLEDFEVSVFFIIEGI